MGSGIREKIMSLRRFSELCGCFQQEWDEELLRSQEEYYSDEDEFLSGLHDIDEAMHYIEEECDREYDRRSVIVRNGLERAKRLLDGIDDPHWHRMKQNYLQTTAPGAQEDCVPERLLQMLNAEINRLDMLTGRLQSAFIPPSVSSAIGLVYHPYRQNIYRMIAVTRTRILDCADRIMRLSDLEEKREFASNVMRTKKREAVCVREEKRIILPQELQRRRESLKRLFAEGVHHLDTVESVFEYNRSAIELGTFVYQTNNAPAFREGEPEILTGRAEQKKGIAFPVSIEQIEESVLFKIMPHFGMARFFMSVALDILRSEANSEIYLADIEGLGSSYSPMSRLTRSERVAIWSRPSQLSAGLSEISGWITNVYAGCVDGRFRSLREYNAVAAVKKPYKYVFIDRLTENIPEKELESLARIARNGAAAGVYMIASITAGMEVRQSFSSWLGRIEATVPVVEVEDGYVRLTENSSLALTENNIDHKIEEVDMCGRAESERRSKIPLGPRLPGSEDWQKKSSAEGLEVAVGLDRDGCEVILNISEEKPYGLIIGDVDVGKSSLLHTIIIQLLANYSDSEVKLAIGDFKDGAEFNIYAGTNIRSLEAVINDEDSDTMQSFLKYYISEMYRRQTAFEQLEALRGSIVRKYEAYRQVNSKLGYPMPDMPRIVLIIDEFQSLFETGAATAIYLNELVRKGRTYGIHIIMASQRAVSDNPRNGFTTELRNYFTSRFVFRTPQAAARTVLSERCADTGCENSGIQAAALLKKGQSVYNRYMGQTERDNTTVQCFYASDELILQFCRVMNAVQGNGKSILLKRNAKSPQAPKRGESERILLGNSTRLLNDTASPDMDVIRDNGLVWLDPHKIFGNMIISGADIRVPVSILKSLLRYNQSVGAGRRLNIFSSRRSGVYRALLESADGLENHIQLYASPEEQKAALTALLEDPVETNKGLSINVFIEPESNPDFVQAVSGFRPSQGADLLKRLLVKTQSENCIVAVYSRFFKNIRTSLPYLLQGAPIRITCVGDAENLRNATSENCRFNSCDFDIPRDEAIKAYYYNKDSEKYGKVILYAD
ncbi:FtsK/SpoIIIE domain-containing protein [Enterocloster lavalensis]|uniref:FtsK/SpoIIIE domain-containing protein n=1 Tax=Enterocloster lavalensis TaxID=460384 RepID=UPI001D05C555|nr:FtsK/SpoIIIE domain-containing protein [Enterocloster lavalensis]MCB6344145.1 hypothetical protein [Enterocloster lavalensis]